jgi:hypothetical protein
LDLIKQNKLLGWSYKKRKEYSLILRRKKNIGVKIIPFKEMGPKYK